MSVSRTGRVQIKTKAVVEKELDCLEANLVKLPEEIPSPEDSDYLFAVVNEDIKTHGRAGAFCNLMEREFGTISSIIIKERGDGIQRLIPFTREYHSKFTPGDASIAEVQKWIAALNAAVSTLLGSKKYASSEISV